MQERKEPWMMTRDEWNAMKAELAAMRQTSLRDGGDVRAIEGQIEWLHFDAHRRERGWLEAHQASKIQITPSVLTGIVERLKQPIDHRLVVLRALRDLELSVPWQVVQDYPDLTVYLEPWQMPCNVYLSNRERVIDDVDADLYSRAQECFKVRFKYLRPLPGGRVIDEKVVTARPEIGASIHGTFGPATVTEVYVTSRRIPAYDWEDQGVRLHRERVVAAVASGQAVLPEIQAEHEGRIHHAAPLVRRSTQSARLSR